MLRTNLKSVPDFDKSVLVSLCCQNIIGSYRYDTIYDVRQTSQLTSNISQIYIQIIIYLLVIQTLQIPN